MKNRKKMNGVELLQLLAILTVYLFFAVVFCSCASTGKALTASASTKNLDLSGYVLVGKIETANSETGTPNGELITGRVTYKSRRVSIPEGQKVPDAGSYRKTVSKSLFGAEETIIEWDYTSSTASGADAAREAFTAQQTLDETETPGSDAVKPGSDIDVLTTDAAAVP